MIFCLLEETSVKLVESTTFLIFNPLVNSELDGK
jgi:hypothetical protein